MDFLTKQTKIWRDFLGCKLELFINELSLHEQLHDRNDFKEALKVFYSVFALLNQKGINKQIFKSNDLFVKYSAIKNQFFVASLNTVPDRSLARAVKNILFNKLNARDWQSERKHSPDDLFTLKDEDEIVTDTSMAELAERKLQDAELIGMLVNFPRSRFANCSSALVIKNEDYIDLDCVEDKVSLQKLLDKILQLNTFEYDDSSNIPPTDQQTILRDTSRFKSTSLAFHGRRVYQEAKTAYYWYVDNLHYGKSAHLEVFNSQGIHLGEANLEGQVDFNKNDPAKRLHTR